jgi:o-succinylbenzoate synthase
MKLARFDLYRYELPLSRSLLLKGKEYTTRSGIIVRVEDENEAFGWGEIAPLPGFSDESLEQAESQLRELRSSLQGQPVPENLDELSGGFDRWLGQYKLYPSVRFGVEMAILNLAASGRSVLLVDVMADDHPNEILINAMLTGTADEIIQGVKKRLEQGYRVMKLKVGRQEMAQDIKLLHEVCELVSDKVAIRLDANRAWSYNDARVFAEAMQNCNVDYVEEPLEDSAEMGRLIRETEMPVALDETMVGLSPEWLVASSGIRAIVLKPMLIGGFEIAMKFARKAIRSNLKAVISSSYESGIGLSALAHLAGAFNRPETAHGLDTLNWFSDDLTAEPLDIESGNLDLRKLTSSPLLKMSLLSEISDE